MTIGQKIVKLIEKKSVGKVDGVWVDTDERGNIVVYQGGKKGGVQLSDKYKTKYLLCSERCIRKEHFGTFYRLRDGTSVFVCNFFLDKDSDPMNVLEVMK